MSNQPKEIHFGSEARDKLLEGARILAECVGVTYGPGGRIVMLDRSYGTLATKDGVTVARDESRVSDSQGCLYQGQRPRW